MSSYGEAVAGLRSQVRKLTDQAELRELFDRYVVALDASDASEYDEAWFAGVFTDDAEFAYPIGSVSGLAGFVSFRREARGRWARTHHISANHDIVVDGDRATLRVRQTAVHVHHGPDPLAPFEVGGHYEARAVRADGGWRLSRLAFHVVWTTGDGLPAPSGSSR